MTGGFIEIHEYPTNTSILLNVNYINYCRPPIDTLKGNCQISMNNGEMIYTVEPYGEVMCKMIDTFLPRSLS